MSQVGHINPTYYTTTRHVARQLQSPVILIFFYICMYPYNAAIVCEKPNKRAVVVYRVVTLFLSASLYFSKRGTY